MSELTLTENNKKVRPDSKANQCIGMTKTNKHGEEMTIVSYKNALDIEVKFKGQNELVRVNTNILSMETLEATLELISLSME